jgi:DNA-binding CsgD family transcriptional regulator
VAGAFLRGRQRQLRGRLACWENPGSERAVASARTHRSRNRPAATLPAEALKTPDGVRVTAISPLPGPFGGQARTVVYFATTSEGSKIKGLRQEGGSHGKRVVLMPDDRSSLLSGSLSDLLASRGLQIPMRDDISMSWRRSEQAGLDPQHLHISHLGDVDPEALLLRASRPVVDQLLNDLGTVQMSVVISDHRAQVLDRRETSRRLAARLESVELVPGAVFAEKEIGTNGIGSVLAAGRSILVEGAEHFQDAFVGTACAGAPIGDPKSGRILGVIDLTCQASDAHPLMLAMAARAARLIEQRLIDVESLREKLVLQQFLQKQRRARGPVVFLDTKTMLSNAAASRLVYPADELVLRENARWIVSEGLSGFQEIALGTDRRVSVRCETVLDGSDFVGIMLELRAAPTPELGLPDSTADPIRRWANLTSTERHVVEFVIDGFTNKQIAKHLFISAYTVDSHIRSIFKKLGVRSRVELTRVATGPQRLGQG